jgi:hypothetical protein
MSRAIKGDYNISKDLRSLDTEEMVYIVTSVIDLKKKQVNEKLYQIGY